ncbi:MAG: hypothetical protein A4E53_03286 [Pelotomaculum sp. PtaB.Bin104]|nr:MAG: hypothetical protein A4E53_03286 [Pelotomaculum sp. PtaB.Bin104]
MESKGVKIEKKKKEKLYIYNETSLPDNRFRYYKGSCVFEEKEGINYLHINNVKFFTPDLKKAIIEYSNLDITNNKEIARLIRKYGLLGLVHFFTEREREIIVWKYYPGQEWSHLFGVSEYETKVSPFTIGRECFVNSSFWQHYHEPVVIFQMAVSQFRDAVYTLCQVEKTVRETAGPLYATEDLAELRWLNQKHGRLTFTLEYTTNGKPLFAMPTNSLLGAMCGYLVWTVKNYYPIRQCPNCGKFVWADDRQHRRLFCCRKCTTDSAHATWDKKRKAAKASGDGK